MQSTVYHVLTPTEPSATNQAILTIPVIDQGLQVINQSIPEITQASMSAAGQTWL